MGRDSSALATARRDSLARVPGNPDVMRVTRRDSLREGPPDTVSTATTRTRGAIAVHSGDWIVRLDQPYSATPRTLLAIQKYKADDPPPYDDTGWTLEERRPVEGLKIAGSAILPRPMQLLTSDARVEGTVASGSGPLLVRHLGDWRSAVLPWKVAPATVSVAGEVSTAGGQR